MIFKGTKGTWCIVGDAIHNRETKFDQTGARIGDTTMRICTIDIQPYKGESEANAKLIAAAPDLLSTLIEIKHKLFYLLDCEDSIDEKLPELHDISVKAIRKAIT
jgi:hypothetical protein